MLFYEGDKTEYALNKQNNQKKMKQLLYILILIGLLSSCRKTPFTCEFSSERVTKQIDLQDFDTIEINPLVQLKIYDTTVNKMQITVSKDVWKNIDYKIVNRKLILTNHTDCLIENQEAIAFVDLYVDDIKCLIANTDLRITSGNTWQFDRIDIICENNQIGTNNIADFNLKIGMNRLNITANGTSIFNISGSCNNLFIGFYGGNPIFKGQNLKSQNIQVFQRSDADMHLYPIQKITGNLYGYGDIYLYHRPPFINITEHYAGHIYFVN